jgi:hypothetical protein
MSLTALALMEELGHAGLTVSVCFGPCGDHLIGWSVDVLNREGQSFERPMAAKSFEHAVAIAIVESTGRGWFDAGVAAEQWEERR